MRHAAMSPALPLPALQCSDTTFILSASNHAFAFSQKSITDSNGGHTSSVKGYLQSESEPDKRERFGHIAVSGMVPNGQAVEK